MPTPRHLEPNYVAVHTRLRRERGRAGDYICSSCGEPASDWAYDHSDPNEQVDERGRPYSFSLDHYKPLCVKCHRALDQKDECSNGHPLTNSNTYSYRGSRYCRECRKLYQRKRRRT